MQVFCGINFDYVYLMKDNCPVNPVYRNLTQICMVKIRPYEAVCSVFTLFAIL